MYLNYNYFSYFNLWVLLISVKEMCEASERLSTTAVWGRVGLLLEVSIDLKNVTLFKPSCF